MPDGKHTHNKPIRLNIKIWKHMVIWGVYEAIRSFFYPKVKRQIMQISRVDQNLFTITYPFRFKGTEHLSATGTVSLLNTSKSNIQLILFFKMRFKSPRGPSTFLVLYYHFILHYNFIILFLCFFLTNVQINRPINKWILTSVQTEKQIYTLDHQPHANFILLRVSIISYTIHLDLLALNS